MFFNFAQLGIYRNKPSRDMSCLEELRVEGKMGPDGVVIDCGSVFFEEVAEESGGVLENLKPLACELRSTLFPIRDGDIFTGTFHDHDRMYDGRSRRSIGQLAFREKRSRQMHKEARTGSQDCGRFVDGFLSFLFAYKGLVETVLYRGQ